MWANLGLLLFFSVYSIPIQPQFEDAKNPYFRGVYHCTTGLQFEWFGFSSFSIYK